MIEERGHPIDEQAVIGEPARPIEDSKRARILRGEGKPRCRLGAPPYPTGEPGVTAAVAATDAFHCKAGRRGKGSNLLPLPCAGSALPMSYAPVLAAPGGCYCLGICERLKMCVPGAAVVTSNAW